MKYLMYLHKSMKLKASVVTTANVDTIMFTSLQLLDGETIREWLGPVYVYADGTGFSLPWELVPLGNYTLRTKDGVMNGYNAEFQMAVRYYVNA